MGRAKIFGILSAAFSLALLISVGCSDSPPETPPAPTAAPVAVSIDTPTAEPMSEPTSTAQPTATTEPTSTPQPTYTPEPTAIPTPEPTSTPRPTILDGFVNSEWLLQDIPDMYDDISTLEWVADGISESESKPIQSLLYIAATREDTAWALIEMPWFADGPDEHESRAVSGIKNIVYDNEALAAVVIEAPWIKDGLDEDESWAVNALANLAYEAPEAAVRIVEMPWLMDDLDAHENLALGMLGNISLDAPEAAATIAKMPFLSSIEPSDAAALKSLSIMAYDAPDALDMAMSHPTIADGITDDETPVVALLHDVNEKNPSLISVLLDPANILIENREIDLPIAGRTHLAIVRTQPGAAGGMDILENAVRNIEDYMDTAFPTNFVLLLYENALPSGSRGQNAGTNMVILPEYDIDDDSDASRIIAHEVAHYYWDNSAELWIDEGAADFIAYVIEDMRSDEPLSPLDDPPCAYAENLASLEDLGYSESGDCKYSLGARFFLDLSLTLDSEDFMQGFRDLYLLGKDAYEDDPDARSVKNVREAFGSIPDAIDVVIPRWYDGSAPHNLERLDHATPNPELPFINGRIDRAYVSHGEDGPPIQEFTSQSTSDWLRLNLEYSYDISGDPREIALDIVEYYEDGFEFYRNQIVISAKEEYTGGSHWLEVGFPPDERWAKGRYWIYVYEDDRKVAEVQYTVN